MLPSTTAISQANGQLEDHKTYIKVSGMTGSIPANSQQEVDSIYSSRVTPNVCAGSPIKLTSPERIIAMHRELAQNHHKNCQVSKNFAIVFSLVESNILGSHLIDHIDIWMIGSRDAQWIVSLNKLRIINA